MAARDADSIGTWLCGRVFEGGDAILGFARDGFFGLRIAPPGKSVQNITGLWRLSSDGVDLTLLNQQDARIEMSVGNGALHGSFGPGGQITLLPVQKEAAPFTITGLLRLSDGRASLTDAASGRVFPVQADASAKDGMFATVEAEISRGTTRTGKMIRHSRQVPRLYNAPVAGNAQKFDELVCDRFWLLPSLKGVEKAALRFSRPHKNQDNADLKGVFELAGPGLRLEGTYTLIGGKLTLAASRASVRNLEIIGAGEIARLLPGEKAWQVSPRGLELTGADGSILLLASQDLLRGNL